MRIYEVEILKLKDATILVGQQIAILAWKIPDKTISEGIYSVYPILLNQGELGSVKIPSIVTKNKWMQFPNRSWFNITEADDAISVGMTGPSENDISNWKFIVGVKTPEEPGDEKLELDTVIDVQFCQRWDENVYGKKCPINPETGQPMKHCLNWRRNDEKGAACRVLLSEKEKLESIDTFCLANTLAEDCKCHNREFYEEYRKMKKSNPEHDYCWYVPCGSDSFLRKEKVDCDATINQTNFNVNDTGGNVSFRDISTDDTGRNGNNQTIIIIIGIILISILVLKR